MKKAKILAVVAAVALTVMSLAGCTGSGSSDSAKKLVIGGTGPITGEAASYGISVKQGAELAVKEIGKINGMEIEFLFEDDVADPAKVMTAYETLMDKDMKVFMGAVTSGASVALNESIAKDGIFQITPSASQIEAASVNSNAFRICFTDPLQGKAMAEYIYQTVGLKKAGIIYNQDDSYSTGMYNAFKARFTELGGTVVADTSFSKDAKDFNAQVTTVKSSDAEFLYLPIYAEKAAQIILAASGKELALPVFGGDGLDGILNYLSGDNAKLAEGLIYLTPFVATDKSENVSKFVEAYKKAYNAVPDQFAADAYDAIYVIKAAIEKAGVTDASISVKELGEKMTAAMTQIEVEGLTGKMTFTAEGEPNKAAKVAKIVNGEYVAQ